MTTRRTTRSRTSSSAPVSNSPQIDGKIALRVKKKSGTSIKAKTTASKKIAAKINSFKPKKPPTTFFYFLENFRKEYQEKNPNIKSMCDVGKACGVKWRTMIYEEKVKYYDIATEKRAKFETAMSDFIKKKENGEFNEVEDDSEFEE